MIVHCYINTTYRNDRCRNLRKSGRLKLQINLPQYRNTPAFETNSSTSRDHHRDENQHSRQILNDRVLNLLLKSLHGQKEDDSNNTDDHGWNVGLADMFKDVPEFLHGGEFRFGFDDTEEWGQLFGHDQETKGADETD